MKTRKKFKLALLGFLALTLIIAGVVLFQKQRSSQTGITVPVPPSAAKALLALTGVRQTATKNGVLQWELDAETAELESRSGRMVLKAPQVDFFMEDGTRIHLTAEQGVLDTNSNDMQVQGNVRVSEDRYTMVAERLDYNHAARILSSDKPVHIFGRSADLTAERMTYDLNTSQARFEGSVRGILDEHFTL